MYVLFVLRILIVYNAVYNGFKIISFFPVLARKNRFDFCERICNPQRSDATPKTGAVITNCIAVQSIETVLTRDLFSDNNFVFDVDSQHDTFRCILQFQNRFPIHWRRWILTKLWFEIYANTNNFKPLKYFVVNDQTD